MGMIVLLCFENGIDNKVYRYKNSKKFSNRAKFFCLCGLKGEGRGGIKLSKVY